MTAAGCLIDPPVSVPMPRGAKKAETAAEEPPEDPPGIFVKSQGFLVGKYALFSVDEPMANSSMFVLPRITIPAFFKFLTTVES